MYSWFMYANIIIKAKFQDLHFNLIQGWTGLMIDSFATQAARFIE